MCDIYFFSGIILFRTRASGTFGRVARTSVFQVLCGVIMAMMVLMMILSSSYQELRKFFESAGHRYRGVWFDARFLRGEL